MKTMIYSLTLAALLTSFVGCSDNNDPVLTQKDWDGTATYFKSTDAKSFDTYYKPYAGYVGDPMPFYDPVAKDFKIMYLQEFRPNQAGTYHPIWALSTKDAGNYIALGELISCGGLAEQDAAIGTGSTIYNTADKLYYTFYTGNKYRPTSSENGQVVMVATSSDFMNWTKDRNFYLKGDPDGYSKNDFRDPFVFEGEDGKYHMLVSTTKDGRGVLAEYTSTDMKDWNHAGVFMPMHWDRFYECPDVFKMGDWWYLVYSDMSKWSRKVQYFKGCTLDELKKSSDPLTFPDSKEGVLDSRAFYAGKTASDGTDRYIWGWCPTRPGNDNTDVGADNEPEWAGNLVAHKIVQHQDGTISFGLVEGISRKYNVESVVKVMEKSEGVSENSGSYTLTGNSYALFNRLNAHNKISFTVKTASNADKFGFSFVRGTDSEKYYTIVVNPEDNNNKRKINFEEEGVAGKGFIAGIDGYLFDTPAGNVYNVTICTDNSVCVVYINDNVAYTNRIYGIQKNLWSINSYSGTVEVSNLKVGYY
ncbi:MULTISPECIES: glycoside hydrolase family 32 protein [unclassified Dysgonomonas]|jgi:beta-fructofuranosidase|uniref:glycoside hydrolase family 32 protein n=1 Tax=unclassified Dysgonomonas TaxID=2630389 RepID=UPI0025B7D776|nr:MULTISPECIES: glycoside hydrolase family 32 protein [unclassified Dysgonomonas]MDR2005469.1 DUF4975 domain-containing protein [Prevotella sp.]HMM02480.1 glycoside hydrolase family 32 protein [Dysgonomonas sp.]